MIDLKLLIKNGVHYGHQRSRWSPKMAPYIWGFKNDVHLIDVSKTAYGIEQASRFLESVIAGGGNILFVGTKKAAQPGIESVATSLNLPYVNHRWIGGTFTNYRQVQKARAKLLHFEDILAKSQDFNYTKKELNVIQKRLEQLKKNFGGVKKLTWPIGAVVVVDVKKEDVCVKEAASMGIPVVGLVDTNSDPSLVDYVIPANDDAPRSINAVLSYLEEAIKKAQASAEVKPKEKEEVVLETIYEGPKEFASTEEEDDEGKPRKRKAAADSKVVAKPSVKPAPVKRFIKKPEAASAETKRPASTDAE